MLSALVIMSSLTNCHIVRNGICKISIFIVKKMFSHNFFSCTLSMIYSSYATYHHCLNFGKVQFTRNYTQTAKRAADNKRRYAPGKGHSACLLWGYPKGAAPHLAHDFAKQSVVCYTLCRRCCENVVAAGEGKGI